MNRPISGFALLLLLLLTGSCNIFRPATTTLPERNANFLLKKLIQQQVEADWFSARARISYQDDYTSVSATSNLRMRKDSAIWLNLKKLSIEAGRALIRPDSFFVIDRINRQYARQPVSAIADMFQVPANYQILQTVLLGNPFFLSTDLEAGIAGDQYTLKGEDDRFATTYFIDGRDFSLRKLSIVEKGKNREVHMSLSQYGQLDKKQKFSYIRTLNLISPETGPLQVEIEFSRVEVNIPKSIDFEIPSRYTEINQP